MQTPSAPIMINEQQHPQYDIEYGHGQILLVPNNATETQRYTCKIVVNGFIYVLLVCAVAFIIYEHHVIIGLYLGKIDDM